MLHVHAVKTSRAESPAHRKYGSTRHEIPWRAVESVAANGGGCDAARAFVEPQGEGPANMAIINSAANAAGFPLAIRAVDGCRRVKFMFPPGDLGLKGGPERRAIQGEKRVEAPEWDEFRGGHPSCRAP